MASKRQLSISELWKKPRLEEKRIDENVVEPDRRGQGGSDNSESDTETANGTSVSQASQPQRQRQPVLANPVLANPVLANDSSADEEEKAPEQHGHDEPGRSQPKGPTSDLSEINEPVTQPRLESFPQTTKSGKMRCFSQGWYKQFDWVEYSTSRDAIFCKCCRHFPGARREYAFTRDGFRDWKHLRLACEKHERSKTHIFARGQLLAYKECHKPNSRGTVLNQMDQDAANMDFIERNRAHVKVVLDIIMMCAQQDIPLRGHRETEEALNKGNFLTMFKFISKYAPEVQARLEQLPRNATMMSPEIQNELLKCAASLLLRKIKKEVKESTHFAILADEYKDQSKRELVAVSLRYVHNGMIKERAIGFAETADLTADGIATKILELLEQFELDPSQCVGFCFDGASVMSGNRGGVHVILKQTFPRAIYTHCSSHRLNLVLCTVAKVSGNISTFFDIVNDIHNYMSGARRHARFMEVQKEMHPNRQPRELERATDVRWSSKSDSVSKTLELLDVILETLAEFSEESGQTKTDAENLLQQIQTKKFIFLLVTFAKLFDVSDFATKGLQSPNVCVTDCIDLIGTLKDSFSSYRANSNGDFDKVLKLTDELMRKNDISNWDVTSSRQRQLPARLKDTVVTTSLGKSSSIKTNEDLRQMWNALLDRQIMELDSRFRDDTYGIMHAAASLIPGSTTFGIQELLRDPCKLFGIVIEEPEYSVFIQQLRRKMTAGESFPSLMEVLDKCPSDIFPNVSAMLQAIITLPMTSCTVERVFSTANRIKNRLRASMGTIRLNHFSLLSFERELSESLDYDEIITIFNNKPRRLRLVL